MVDPTIARRSCNVKYESLSSPARPIAIAETFTGPYPADGSTQIRGAIFSPYDCAPDSGGVKSREGNYREINERFSRRAHIPPFLPIFSVSIFRPLYLALFPPISPSVSRSFTRSFCHLSDKGPSFVGFAKRRIRRNARQDKRRAWNAIRERPSYRVKYRVIRRDNRESPEALLKN